MTAAADLFRRYNVRVTRYYHAPVHYGMIGSWPSLKRAVDHANAHVPRYPTCTCEVTDAETGEVVYVAIGKLNMPPVAE